jgi:uncharacterized protein (TIGR03083 family)
VIQTYDDYVTGIRADASAIAAIMRSADPQTPVPTCPGWTVSDLAKHVGRVHRWAALAVGDRNPARPIPPSEIESPAPGADMGVWFEGGVPLLLEALTAAGPDRPVWGWAGDNTSDFWARRQAHETTIHRVDMQLAVGDALPIPADLAVDGIDEHLDILVGATGLGVGLKGDGETVHLHATDADGEWLLRRTADGLEVERTHATGDVEVRAGASDLWLLLTNRRDLDGLEVHGDATIVDDLRRAAAL